MLERIKNVKWLFHFVSLDNIRLMKSNASRLAPFDLSGIPLFGQTHIYVRVCRRNDYTFNNLRVESP